MEYFDTAIEFGNLYKALKQSCRDVRWKDSVVGYEANGLRNTYQLRQDLLSGKYKISPYQHFKVYEPKERDIVATRIRDRQFQKALCNGGLYEDFVEHLIHDNGACQVNKGTDFTLDRMTAHLRRYFNEYGTEGWVLKCDIKKFFPSTPHDVAIRAVEKRVSDPRAAQAVINVIKSFGGDGKGIGLGSQISQLVELSVLDDLDHFIKERLHIKYYLRYMDDFILIHPDKEYLQYCLKEIRIFVEMCGLTLNAKTTLYPLRQGVRMLNWRFVITDTGRILKYMNNKKLGQQRRKMRKLMAKEIAGEVAPGTTKGSLTAWMANAKRGTTFYQRQRMTHYYYEIKGGTSNEQSSKQRASQTCENGVHLQSNQR